MTRAFLFLLMRSSRNRVLAILRRLRRPKYLAFALVGLGYLYLVFFRQMMSRPRSSRALPLPADVAMLPLMETIFSLALLGLVLLPWLWPGRGSDGLRFSEAEIQFLFPAPVSRRALLHYRLVKMQLGVLFGVVISFVFLGRGRIYAHPVYALATLWLVYSFLALYYLGTTLVQTSLVQHGVSGIKRQAWVLAILAALAAMIGIWLKWFLPPLPQPGGLALQEISAWLLRLTEAGPAYYFLLPFNALVRPAFAPDPASFYLRVVPATGIVAAAYLWVMHTDVVFEEASLEKARRTASLLEAAGSGGLRTSRRLRSNAGRPLFRLKPTGFPGTAVFWKNLVAIRRTGALTIVPVIAVVGVGMAVVFAGRGGRGEVATAVIGSLAGVMAGFMTLIGPTMVRDDLRTDLAHMELLKTYPLPGWSVVLGEVLAPTSFLALTQWILLLISAWTIPSLGAWHFSGAHRLAIGISIAMVLPGITLMGVLIQNAAVLILPGWVPVGRERRRGVEAMGQNLITMAATVLALILAAVPAGLLFALVWIPGYLAGWALAALPPAALLAALGLIAEAALGILWLGRVYDRFDVSREGPGG